MEAFAKIQKQIEKQLAGIFGLPEGYEIKWQTPPKPEWGDMALPIFEIAKIAGMANQDAVGAAQKIKLPPGIEEMKVVGGYVNFFIDAKIIAPSVLRQVNKEFGQNKLGQNKKIMFEFSQPNTHKEFHIGHVRNAVLGQSLVNILKASGYRVIAANYLGDVGAHVAKWIWCYQKWHPKEEPKDKVKFLSRVYEEATEKAELDPKYKEEIAEAQRRLEQGDKELVNIWKKSRRWSLEAFNKIYKTLGVKFDVDFFESEEEKPGKELVKKLLQEKIAKKSQGAIVMDLEKYNLGIFLLLKSDGSALYATKDLALAFKKFKKYKLDQSWYLVDSRQSLYFNQLFRTLELAGLKKPLKHLIYEFVSLPEGVISSRAGRMVSFNDLYDKVFDMAEAETRKRHQKWTVKKLAHVSKTIALAAIKFDMLKQSREKQIVFDPKQALSFEGFTGPYLLYSLARINSILKKAGAKKKKTGKIDNFSIEPIEKQLLLKIEKFPRQVEQSAKISEPAVIAQHLFDLCQSFAEFYHQLPVIKAQEPVRAWRIELIKRVKQMIENGMDLLGIDVLEEM